MSFWVRNISDKDFKKGIILHVEDYVDARSWHVVGANEDPYAARSWIAKSDCELLRFKDYHKLLTNRMTRHS